MWTEVSQASAAVSVFTGTMAGEVTGHQARTLHAEQDVVGV